MGPSATASSRKLSTSAGTPDVLRADQRRQAGQGGGQALRGRAGGAQEIQLDGAHPGGQHQQRSRPPVPRAGAAPDPGAPVAAAWRPLGWAPPAASRARRSHADPASAASRARRRPGPGLPDAPAPGRAGRAARRPAAPSRRRVIQLGSFLERVGGQLRGERLLGEPAGQPVQPAARRPSRSATSAAGSAASAPRVWIPQRPSVSRTSSRRGHAAAPGGDALHRQRRQEGALAGRSGTIATSAACAATRATALMRRWPPAPRAPAAPPGRRSPAPPPLARGVQPPTVAHLQEQPLGLGLDPRGEGVAHVGQRRRGGRGVRRRDRHHPQRFRAHSALADRPGLTDQQPGPHPHRPGAAGARQDPGPLAPLSARATASSRCSGLRRKTACRAGRAHDAGDAHRP